MQQTRELIDSAQVYEQLAEAERILMPHGRHRERVQKYLGELGASVLYDDPRDGGLIHLERDNISKPFDSLRDSSIPISVNNVPGTVGFGCFHQYVETLSVDKDLVHRGHMFAVEGAHFGFATINQPGRIEAFLQKLSGGEQQVLGAEHAALAYEVAAHHGYTELEFIKLPPGTNEWSGLNDPRLDGIFALYLTRHTLRTRNQVPVIDLEQVYVDVFWSEKN